jgi:hypothetical protein
MPVIKLSPQETSTLTETGKSDADLYDNYRKIYLANQSTAQDIKNAMEALQYVRSGAGTGLSLAAGKWLRSTTGINPTTVGLSDPAQIEIIRKAAARTLGGAVKAVVGNNQPALGEFAYLKPGSIDENSEPEALRAIGGSLLSTMNWQDQLFNSLQAHRNQTGSPVGFDVAAFGKQNPMPQYYSEAIGGIPALKGEHPLPQHPGVPAAPPRVIVGPKGDRLIEQNGQWVPLTSSAPMGR